MRFSYSAVLSKIKIWLWQTNVLKHAFRYVDELESQSSPLKNLLIWY